MPSPQPSQSSSRANAAPTSAIAMRTDFQQLDHEIGTLKEIIFAKFEQIVTRFEAMDKAVNLFQDNLTRVPTDVDKQVTQLKALIDAKLDAMELASKLYREEANRYPSEADRAIEHLKEISEEKFDSIAIQFKERDTRTEQSALQTKTAVDAALQAAEKAVGKQQESNSESIKKSETNTTKQIDQIGVFMAAANTATVGKIDDLKQRLTTLEGRTEGHSKGSNEVVGYVIGGILALVGIASLIVSVMHK